MRRPRLAVASIVLAGPGWVSWAITHKGLFPAVATTLVLVANFVATARFPAVKRDLVSGLQRYLINPLFKLLLAIGLPLGVSLLETTGRTSGRPRRTPVGEGREGDTFWIVAEHGRSAGYVRNIEANPAVRVRVRIGWWPRWVSGTAEVVDDDDPHARQRQLCWRHPLRAYNAAIVRTMGTDLVTIRIRLEMSGVGRS